MRPRSGSRNEDPFAVTPDPRFAFDSPSFLSAFLALMGGIERRVGVMVLLGPAGCGKTMLLRAVQDALARNRGFAFFRFQPYATIDDLLASLLTELRVTPVSASREDRLNDLADHLQGRLTPTALLVDEAHCFVDSAIRDFAALAESKSGTPANLQVILAGRPELEQRLQRPELANVAARLAVTARLHPLAPAELPHYVAHRLAIARQRYLPMRHDNNPFEPAALDRVFHYSKGMPRTINRLCGRALSDEPSRITAARIDEAAFACRLALSPLAAQVAVAHAPVARAKLPATVSAAARLGSAPWRVVYGLSAFAAAAGFGFGAAYLTGPDRDDAIDFAARSSTAAATIVLPPDGIQLARGEPISAEAALLRHVEFLSSDDARRVPTEPQPESTAAMEMPAAEPEIVAEPEIAAEPELQTIVEPETPAPENGNEEGSDPVVDTASPAVSDAQPAEPRSDAASGATEAMPDDPAPALGSAPDTPIDAAPHVTPAMAPAEDQAALPQAPTPVEARPVEDASPRAAPPEPPAPAAKPARTPTLDSGQLVARGTALLQQGDPASARLFFERAAAQGHAGAMGAMGRTFDPLELSRLGVIGVSGDSGRALDWYRRAAEAGDQDSRARIATLSDWMARRQGQR